MNRFGRKPKIIVICGPTAVGKTDVAINLAQSVGGEIVNADSVQIYRFMDIGTAKPTPDERKRIAHHLIDIIEPDVPFDANQFAGVAQEIITRLHRKGTVPVVAGGTGFYIKALTQGLFEAEPVEPEIRLRLKKAAETTGLPHLYQRLAEIDPITASSVHPNDKYRIIRALEVFETTGIPISTYQQSHQFSEKPYEMLKIGLNMDRDRLYERIDQRVEAMLSAGLLEEVRFLLKKGYGKSFKSMQTIGYKHMIAFLENEMSWDEAVRTLKRDTRRYAKRQLTWFRKDPEIEWINPQCGNRILETARNFLDG